MVAILIILMKFWAVIWGSKRKNERIHYVSKSDDPFPYFAPSFHTRHAFSKGKSKHRSNNLTRPLYRLERLIAQTTCLGGKNGWIDLLRLWKIVVHWVWVVKFRVCVRVCVCVSVCVLGLSRRYLVTASLDHRTPAKWQESTSLSSDRSFTPSVNFICFLLFFKLT